MSSKIRPWKEQQHHKHGGRKIIPLRVDGNERIIPLRIGNEEMEVGPGDWGHRDQEQER